MPSTEQAKPIPCPACGSTNVLAATHQESYLIPYGPPAEYPEFVYTCQDCKFAFYDANGDNRKHLIDALRKSIHASVEFMLAGLHKQGLTETYIERALRLWPGSIQSWRIDPKLEYLALLRFIYTYPWLLQVADENFSAEAIEAAGSKPKE